MVKQFRILWSATTGARGGESVFHALDTASSGIVQSFAQTFIDAWAAIASSEWSAQLGSELITLDTESGQMVGVAGLTGVAQLGDVVEGAVADATCALLRYSTQGIVNGHRVRGRTFVPGLPGSAVQDGEWNDTTVTALSSLAAQFNVWSFGSVYSRPLYSGPKDARVLVRPGSLHNVTGADAWPQCAVLRARRQR